MSPDGAWELARAYVCDKSVLLVLMAGNINTRASAATNRNNSYACCYVAPVINALMAPTKLQNKKSTALQAG